MTWDIVPETTLWGLYHGTVLFLVTVNIIVVVCHPVCVRDGFPWQNEFKTLTIMFKQCLTVTVFYFFLNIEDRVLLTSSLEGASSPDCLALLVDCPNKTGIASMNNYILKVFQNKNQQTIRKSTNAHTHNPLSQNKTQLNCMCLKWRLCFA